MEKYIKKGIAMIVAFALMVSWIPMKEADASGKYIYIDADNQSEENACVQYAGIGKATTIESVGIFFDEEQYKVTFQWYKKSGDEFSIIKDAKNLDYSLDCVKEEDYTIYRQDITLSEGSTVLKEKSCYYLLENNYGLEVQSPKSNYIFYDEVLPTLTAGFSCEKGYEDKISYQWFYYYLNGDNISDVEITDADSKEYTVTNEVMENMMGIYCQAKVKDSSYSVESDYLYLFHSDRMVDLTKSDYVADVTAAEGSEYVQHVIGASDTSSLILHFDEHIEDCLVQDMDGNLFYVHAEEGKTLSDFEVKGNECYLLSSIKDENQTGITGITQSTTFQKTIYDLIMVETPDKSWYSYGEDLDMTGLQLERVYNDGSTESVPMSDIVWDASQKLKIGTNEVSLTDSVSGLSTYLYIYVDSPIHVEWDQTPNEYIFGDEQQKASVKVSDASGKVKFVWTLYDAEGNKLMDLANGDASEISIPLGLAKGDYVLECYYYEEGLDVESYNYMATFFTVIGEETFQTCSNYPESAHDFQQNEMYSINGYRYQMEGASSLLVTFDERTSLDYFDQVIVYDKKHNAEIFSDDELSGKTIEVQGDTIELLLSVGSYSSAWGFRITNIEKKTAASPSVTPGGMSPSAPAVNSSNNTTGTSKVPANTSTTTIGKTSITHLKSKTKRTVTLKVKKLSKATGYQISYAKDSKFKKTEKKVSSKKINVTIKRLKTQKTYYWRARAYTLNKNGKKVFGQWSKAKKLKVK